MCVPHLNQTQIYMTHICVYDLMPLKSGLCPTMNCWLPDLCASNYLFLSPHIGHSSLFFMSRWGSLKSLFIGGVPEVFFVSKYIQYLLIFLIQAQKSIFSSKLYSTPAGFLISGCPRVKLPEPDPVRSLVHLTILSTFELE